MEDYEQFSSNQVMGRCHVDMSSLKGRETFRKWLELVDEDQQGGRLGGDRAEVGA